MKKALRLVGLLVIAVSLTAVVGCGGSADSPVGKWVVTNDDSGLKQGAEIEFGEDGWMTMPFISKNSKRAMYELTDGSLVITKSDNSVENGQLTVDGDTATLVLPEDGVRGTYQLARVGSKAAEGFER